MRVSICFSFLACLIFSGAAAQSNKQFYVEFGGPGVLMSANYDQRFQPDQSTGFGYRVGVGFGAYEKTYSKVSVGGLGPYYYSEDITRTFASIPVGLNYVFGKSTSPHAFEFGAGATFLTEKVDIYNYGNTKTDGGHVIGYVTAMYRRIPMNGGFTWRIGISPIIGTAGDIMPSAAVGLGYAF